MAASRSQRGAESANPSSKDSQGAVDRTIGVREMAAFVSASLAQALISRMDPTKEMSPKEQQAMADLLEAVFTPPSPSPSSTESSEIYPSGSSLEHDVSSEQGSAPDQSVTVTPPEVSEDEDQSVDLLVADEAIVKTPPEMIAGETTIIDDEAVPPKPRLEAALKKALETRENLVEDTLTTMSPGTADQDEATGIPVSTLEKAESLHRKEGDRVVALKDQFATEVATESVSTESVSQDRKEEEPSPGETATIASISPPRPTTIDEDHVDAGMVTTGRPLRKVDTVQNLVPPTPEAISTAFGRPLPVVIHDVPPLKSIPELATTEKKTAAPTVNSNSDSVAGANFNNENTDTTKETIVAATAGASTLSSSLAAEQEKVVKDEDAYGE